MFTVGTLNEVLTLMLVCDLLRCLCFYGQLVLFVFYFWICVVCVVLYCFDGFCLMCLYTAAWVCVLLVDWLIGFAGDFACMLFNFDYFICLT